MWRREGRGVDSMLANHKRDCIESATGLFSSFSEPLHPENSFAPRSLSLPPSLPSLTLVPAERHTATRSRDEWRIRGLKKKNSRTHIHTDGVTPLICHCALRLAQGEKGYAWDRLFRWGFSGQWNYRAATQIGPTGEQSGLLRGICQHGAAVTVRSEGPSHITRFPFGLRERGWRNEGSRGGPAVFR